MIKIIATIILGSILGIHMANGDKCYICDSAPCPHPTSGDVKDCSDSGDGGVSGSTFITGVFGKDAKAVSTDMSTGLAKNVEAAALNQTIVTWSEMIEWGCYTTRDQRRGCLRVAKGFCNDDKTLPKEITDVQAKLDAFVKSTGKVFENIMKLPGITGITDAQKQNVTKWLSDNYMSKFFDGNAATAIQMNYCCTGDACNFAPMVQTSVLALIISVLSIFILV